MSLPLDFSMPYALASALSRGGKFILTPPKPTPYEDYLAGFVRYRRTVRLRAMFGNKPDDDFDLRYHVPNPTWQPRLAPDIIEAPLRTLHAHLEDTFAGDKISQLCPNVPRSELIALFDIKRRHDIIVKPADKNLGLTLMGRDWYMQECYRQLSDTDVYQEIERAAFDVSAITAKAFKVVAMMARIGLKETERKWLVHAINTCSTVPFFYVTPKLHKVPVKGRPIVASCGWITTPLSKWCADKLAPIVARCGTVLKDTAQLIERLKDVRLPPNAKMLLTTADVESLYTSIPVNDAMDALQQTLIDFEYDWDKARMLLYAVDFVLRHNYLTFDGKIYKQIKGLAMGTPLAPPIADIFMAHLERKMFKRFPGVIPRIYLRYLDDIFILQVYSRLTWNVPFSALREHLSNMHPSIRLTFVTSLIELAMLDLVIYKAGDRLLHRVHQKALNKYLYISPRSCHPPHVMRGLIKTELVRYSRNCSERLDFLRICRAFSSRLRERGFHPTFLRKVFATVQHGYHPPEGKGATPMIFKIPYGGGPEINTLSRVISEWYDACPEAFRAKVPKPKVCYTVGKNIYGMLVRAKVTT